MPSLGVPYVFTNASTAMPIEVKKDFKPSCLETEMIVEVALYLFHYLCLYFLN